MKSVAIITSAIILAISLMACSSAAPTPIPVVELSLTATDIAYDKNALEVMAGQPVKLTLHNEGALEHDFSIMEMPHTGDIVVHDMEAEMAGHDMGEMEMEPEIHMVAPVGGSNYIEFTPSTPGEYMFICTTVGHEEAGMVGTLVVKAP